MWNQEVSRTVDVLKKPFSKWSEMKDVIAYGEARPLDIQKEIKHAVVGYLQIVKQIAHMSESDIDFIRQADAAMGDARDGASKGTLSFLEKIGKHRQKLVPMIANAVHPDSSQYKKTTSQLIRLMDNAQQISEEDMKLPKKDGLPQFDRSIWGYRNIKSNEGQIHATIGHFMSQALFKTVEKHWGKDDLLAPMTAMIILNKLRQPDKPSPIFDLWRKKKVDGGLGWISDKRLQAFEKVFNK